jgi:transcriptional regulator with XRE-family HTH domain
MNRWSWVVRDDPAEQRGLRIIGQAVLRGRIAARLSQRQLGYRVGLNQSTISRLETGCLHAMRMITLARIVGTLNLPSEFARPGEPPAPTRRLPGVRRLEDDRLEAERLAAERREDERLEAERLEAERLKWLEAERFEDDQVKEEQVA